MRYYSVVTLKCFFALGCLLLACTTRGQDDAMRIEIGSDREFYLEDAQVSVCVELRLSGRPAAEDAPPQNIVLVLDRSGSMAGEPLQAAREAMLDTARSARPQDAVSVIFFASEVDPAIELRGDPAALQTRLSEVDAVGGSSTFDALNQGAAQLRRTAKPGQRNHLVLFTDGPATKGPREKTDFVRLAEAFAQEGISISTIGLGPEFDEDVLAAVARHGKGRFHYIESPAKVRDTLANELSSARRVVARNVNVAFEFPHDARRIEPYGSVPHAVEKSSVTWRLPVVVSGEERSLLVSASLRTFRVEATVGTLIARWTDPETGREHSIQRKFKVKLERDEPAVQQSRNVEVLRGVASALATEGMQEAIERIDKGDFRGALRRLRRARTDIDYLNYGLDDPEIIRRVAQLDVYLGEVKTRGLNLLDRKVLRSGLNNQFDSPSAEKSTK